jgi:hypothetical protein
MLFGSSLLLVVWIIGWGVLEIPGRWIHVLPVLAVVPMIVHVMRTVPSKPSRRHGR